APFDLFLSADRETVDLLVKEGLARPDGRLSYGVGQLTVWSPRDQTPPALIKSAIETGKFKIIAMANPTTSPYGRAGSQLLQRLHTPDGLVALQKAGRVVTGENVAQAFQFAHTGNADLAVVALSQVIDLGKGSYWLVPSEWYGPLIQDAVVLGKSPRLENARGFLAFLRSPEIVSLIEGGGYKNGSQ
ncbi:MAG: molybdate ABC transporter substrate-binding protein, partial [Bdellovibrionota bacterium]